jgi:hypothetical protein
MLKKEMNGYSLDTREPNGYCKVEIREGKGKINTYMQGLKPLKDGSGYRVYIIAAQTDRASAVAVASLNVDNKGHAEMLYEFDPDNVDGTGLAIEEFNVAAILLKGDQVKNIIAPFVGYKDRTVVWKNAFNEVIDHEVRKDELTEKKIVVKEEDKKDKVVEKIDIVNEEKSTKNDGTAKIEEKQLLDEKTVLEEKTVIPVTKSLEQETNPHKIFNDMVNKFYAEMEELEKYKVLSSEDLKVLDLDIKVTENDNTDDLMYMFNHNESIIPFEMSNKEINWIKIDPFELVTLNLPTWSYIKHQFINACWKKHKHLILGRYMRNNTFRYILGAPDNYNEDCADIATKLGFGNFVCYNGKTPQKEEKGYWIMEL